MDGGGGGGGGVRGGTPRTRPGPVSLTPSFFRDGFGPGSGSVEAEVAEAFEDGGEVFGEGIALVFTGGAIEALEFSVAMFAVALAG
jgi:hypothetical protein